MFAGRGDDRVKGQGGSDRSVGDTDVNGGLYGGSGVDVLDGGSGRDFAFGATGDDFVWGRQGDDDLNGAAGDDSIAGGKGFDTMDGGRGNFDVCDGEDERRCEIEPG